METFGIYSLKAGVILTVFWGIYLLFLQKETFYRFNRIFLLAGLAAAVMMPLIVIRYTVEIHAPAIPTVSTIPLLPAFPVAESSTIPINATRDFSFMKWCNTLLLVIYLTIVIVLLVVQSAGLTRILRSIRRHDHKQFAGYHLIESSEYDHAFSFFRFVFIPSGLNEEEKNMILKHEKAHIGQSHWFDLCITNLLSLIWWFNPIFRLYEKAVRNNHEYLADREVLTDYQPENYQRVLLNQWFQTPVLPIANSFSYNHNLKRFLMMKKNISNPTKKLFALLAIPALAIFLMAFFEKEYVVKVTEEDKIHYLTVQNDEIVIDFYGENTRNDVAAKMTQDDQTLELHANLMMLIFSDQNYKSFDLNNQDKDKPLILVDSKEVQNIHTIDPKEIENITFLKNKTATDAYGEKGKNGVIVITTKANVGVKAEKASGQIQFDGNKLGWIPSEEDQKKQGDINSLTKLITDKPLIMVDGKEVQMYTTDPNEIEYITILKEKAATDVYGEKGKNGVVIITTKTKP